MNTHNALRFAAENAEVFIDSGIVFLIVIFLFIYILLARKMRKYKKMFATYQQELIRLTEIQQRLPQLIEKEKVEAESAWEDTFDNLKREYEESFQKQANVADKTIKKLQVENRKLRDWCRVQAVDYAKTVTTKSAASIITEARIFYTFLVGK